MDNCNFPCERQLYIIVLIFLIALPIVAKASGIFSPTVSKMQVVEKGDLKWYAIIKSLNIQKEQTELKRRWNHYWERLNQYAVSHPEINQKILKEMKYCRVGFGMTEEQVLFIVQPTNINSINGEKVFFYEVNLERRDTWIKTWVTIKDGKVINIEEQTSTYGW